MHPDTFVAWGEDESGSRTSPELAFWPKQDDEPEAESDDAQGRAVKQARNAGRLEAFQWMASWLGAAGIIGIKSQAVALVYALKIFPDANFTQLCQRAGILKQTGHLSLERLNELLPKLFVLGMQNDGRIANQSKAMAESWKRRRK